MSSPRQQSPSLLTYQGLNTCLRKPFAPFSTGLEQSNSRPALRAGSRKTESRGDSRYTTARCPSGTVYVWRWQHLGRTRPGWRSARETCSSRRRHFYNRCTLTARSPSPGDDRRHTCPRDKRTRQARSTTCGADKRNTCWSPATAPCTERTRCDLYGLLESRRHRRVTPSSRPSQETVLAVVRRCRRQLENRYHDANLQCYLTPDFSFSFYRNVPFSTSFSEN